MGDTKMKTQFLKTLTSYDVGRGSSMSSKQRDVQTKQYITDLNGLGSDAWKDVQKDPALALSHIDPATNSIGCALVLERSLEGFDRLKTESQIILQNAVVSFCLEFVSWQIRYAGQSLLAIVDKLQSPGFLPPTVTVQLLANIILKLDASGSLFTSTHLALARYAYQQDCTEPALRVINLQITSFPGMAGPKDNRPLATEELPPHAYISASSSNRLSLPVTHTKVLEYNIYCALIHMARKDWQKAQKALERIITHPATKDKTISKFVVEAYKKWVLVGLLSNGRAPVMPTSVSKVVASMLDSMAPKYSAVANLYGSDDPAELKTEIESNGSVWAEDDTESLIAEVVAAYQKWEIMNLRLVYRQVPLKQVQEETWNLAIGQHSKELGEIVALVQSMVESGMLKGEIQAGNGGEETYLKFYEDRESLTESDFTREVARAYQSIEALTKDYQATNERLSSSKEYVKHVIQQQQRASKDAADGFDTQVEEEDLMTGIMSHG